MTKDWEETDYAPSEIELASPAPGGLTAAQFEVLTKESAIKAKNLTNVIENNKGRYVVVINQDAPPFL